MEAQAGPIAMEPRPPPLEDAYKEVERRYKLRKVPINKRQTKFKPTAPDLTGVITFDAQHAACAPESTQGGLLRQFLVEIPELSPQPIPTYEVRDGFFVLRGALDTQAQAYWAYQCVSQFSRLPHTNLTNLHGPCGEHRELWRDVVGGRATMDDFRKLRWANLGFNYIWGRRAYAALSSPPLEAPSQPQSSQPSQPSQSSQEGEGASQPSQLSQPSQPSHSSQPSQSSQQSQGGQGGRVPLPCDLVSLSRRVASAVGFVSPLNAEAGICNFYPLDGSMGGHVDDAESALEQPIVSLSMGHSSIFLLGGRSREEPPLALLIRSGDIVVMGRDSRLCYHGIASILPETVPPALLDPSAYPPEIPAADRPSLSAFLSTSRINLNVRQVLRSN